MPPSTLNKIGVCLGLFAAESMVLGIPENWGLLKSKKITDMLLEGASEAATWNAKLLIPAIALLYVWE